MIIETLVGKNNWEELKEEYIKLYNNCNLKNVFMRYEYLNTWLNRPKNETEEPLIIIGLDNGKLIGIAPLVISYERILGLRFRNIKNMGYGFSDILDWIIAPSFEEEFCRAVLDTLYNDSKYNIISFGSLTQSSTIYKHLSKSIVYNNWYFIEQKESFSPYLLTDYQYHLMEKINKKNVKDSEYILRRMERDGGVEYHSIKDKDELEKWLEIYFDMHIARWKNTETPSRFNDSKEKRYFTHLASEMFKISALELNILKFKSQPIAMHFGFSDSERFYYYLPTYNVIYNKYSPGNTLIYLLLKDANERGLKCFDFLRGNEVYKSKWTDTVVTCNNLLFLRKRFFKQIFFLQKLEYVLSNPILIVKKARYLGRILIELRK